MIRLIRRAAASVFLLLPGILAAQGVERYELTGDRVAIYNLAGNAVVEAGTGSAVVVEVRRQGRDAARLDIQQGPIGPAQTLRVVYPDGDVVFAPERWSGRTEIRVRPDGTFGDGGDRRESGRRVRVSSDGSGTEASADLRILVPSGSEVSVYLAVGPLSATGVTGDLRLDGSSGRVTTERTAGSLIVDVGSGTVTVRGHQGDGLIDTGSGPVNVTGLRGDRLVVDTGSGEVTLADVVVDELNVDTGSGSVEGTGVEARAIMIDTGSGEVDLTLARAPETLTADTGSGSVTVGVPDDLNATIELATSSGEITVDFALQIRRWERDEVRGTIGTGAGHIQIDTGSGNIAIRKL
jgi:lia operon protein LiaG